MTIGQNIKKLCEENNIKQCELAEAIGITLATLSRYISGDREPKLQNICLIADYFGVSVDWLCGRSEVRNYNGMIDGDELLDYCEKASKFAEELRKESLEYDSKNAYQIADCIRAEAYFEHEYCTWKFTIPNMIHSVADGSWKKDGDTDDD